MSMGWTLPRTPPPAWQCSSTRWSACLLLTPPNASMTGVLQTTLFPRRQTILFLWVNFYHENSQHYFYQLCQRICHQSAVANDCSCYWPELYIPSFMDSSELFTFNSRPCDIRHQHLDRLCYEKTIRQFDLRERWYFLVFSFSHYCAFPEFVLVRLLVMKDNLRVAFQLQPGLLIR